ncbi:MAG: MMPL family transporter [Enhygromyxa sp.]
MSEDRLARRRDKFFVGFGRLGVRWPATVSVLLALLTVAGLFFATKLTITTSRFGLVDADNWYQRRMIEFFDAFGYPDSPVAIVEGGSPKQRREAVDQLVAVLEQDEMFAGRVLAKIGAEEIAETLLVAQAGSLAALRRDLPAAFDLPAALEAGLPGAFGLIEAQLLAALDGEIEVDASDGDAQLERLAKLAGTLDQKLAADAGLGEPPDPEALLEGGMMPTAEELRARGLDEQGYFVSNDGERLLVAVFPAFEGDEVDDYAPTVERLRALRDRVSVGEVTISFTGLPFVVVDEESALATGLVRSSIATSLGIFLLLIWAFRSLKRAAVAVLPIAMGTVVSLGALYLLFETLDPITSSFAAVLMGLAIDFSVHLLARYDEDLRGGATRGRALYSALAKAGPGVVTGAVTTSLAFLTIATTEFTSYGEMGVITAIGLVVALLAAMLLLPVMVSRGDLEQKEQPPKPMRGLDFLPHWIRAAPLPIVLVAVSLSLLGATVIPSYNPRYLELLPRSWESTRALKTLEQDGAMTPWFAWVTAEDLEQARTRADALRAMDSVARVDSPSDLLPELDDERLTALRADFEGLERDPDFAKLAARTPTAEELGKRVLAIEDALDELGFAAEQAGRDGKSIAAAKQALTDLRKRLETTPSAAATLDALEDQMAALLEPAWTTARAVAARGRWATEDLPEMFKLRFVASDGSGRIALYVYPAGDISSGADGNAPARRFTEDLESVDPQAAGQGISLYRHNAWILHGFRRASGFSLVLVLILLVLDFANLRKALFALFPVLVGMGWMVGLYAIVDLRLNVATIVVMPLMLGIGIDAGVHMMHRWEINSRAHGGRGRIDEIIHGTGGAVMLSSLTTMVGFAGLLFGQHLGMVQLGAAMVLGIGCSLVASVVVLPALLILFDRAD